MSYTALCVGEGAVSTSSTSCFDVDILHDRPTTSLFTLGPRLLALHATLAARHRGAKAKARRQASASYCAGLSRQVPLVRGSEIPPLPTYNASKKVYFHPLVC